MSRLLAGIVMLSLCAGAACGDRDTRGLVVGPLAPSAADLVGTWTGQEEISQVGDLAWNGTTTDRRGFSFTVGLSLSSDGRFRLTSAGFPADGPRVCTGAFSTRGSTIQFLPAAACPALPLTAFELTGLLGGDLLLEAASPQAPGAGTSGGADVQVRMQVRHD